MRVRFEIENPQALKAGFRSKMVFTERGGLLGASSDNDWPLQDQLNTIPDHLARIEVIDNRMVITTFPGARVYLNGSSSPLRPNRRVLLREDDQISIGALEMRMRENFVDEAEMEYLRLDDAVEVSSLVTINKGYRGFIESPVEDYEDEPQVEEITWPERGSWAERLLVETGRPDPILSMQNAWTHREDLPRDHPVLEGFRAREETDGAVATADLLRPEAVKAKAKPTPTKDEKAPWGEMPKEGSMSKKKDARRDRFGFEEDDEIEDVNLEEPVALSHRKGLRAEDIVLTLSRQLGVPLSEVDDEELLNAVGEVAEALRMAVSGLNAIYAKRGGVERYPFAKLNLHAIEDNPLRFAKSPEEAMRAMFIERSKVHLSPASAVDESLAQLHMHQSATHDGIDAALESVLYAFRPDNLEKRFESYQRGAPPQDAEARDAWNWQTYEAYFNELLSHRQRGLTNLFWEVFQSAYQDSMRKRESNLKSPDEEKNVEK